MAAASTKKASRVGWLGLVVSGEHAARPPVLEGEHGERCAFRHPARSDARAPRACGRRPYPNLLADARTPWQTSVVHGWYIAECPVGFAHVIAGQQAVEPLGLEDAVDRVAVQLEPQVLDDEGEIIDREAGGSA